MVDLGSEFDQLEANVDLHVKDRHTSIGLTSDDLVNMYYKMVQARRLDEKLWSLNRMGKASFAISGQGHEACQVASAWALDKGHDYVLPYYRDIGVVLVCGLSPYEILLGALGRGDDPCSGGRQMPNHWGSARLRIITGSSPIATHLPHAAGIGLGVHMAGGDEVVACYFGDGATSKGDFHEALNFASIYKLPVVFICENNGYAISVPISKESAVTNIAQKASSYDLPGVIVDGNDVLDVYEATKAAVDRARSGEGPTLLECKTYRFLAHTSDDDDKVYRARDEVEAWKKHDPITNLKRYLLEQRLLPEALEQDLMEEIRKQIEESTLVAEAQPGQAPGDVQKWVFAPQEKLQSPYLVASSLEVSQRGPRETTERTNQDPEAVQGTTVNMIEAVRYVLDETLAKDPVALIMGEDVGTKGGVFGATRGLLDKYGSDRVLDTPLAESSIVGIGIGLGFVGFRPIVEIQFADFIHSAFDQIVSEAARICYRSNGDFVMPLVIRAPWGGGVHGALYHSQCIEAFYAHVPGMKVVAPSSVETTIGLFRAAMADPNPVLFLENKKCYRNISGVIPPDDYTYPIGRAQIVRPGSDISVITYGYHRHLALEAADRLSETVSVEVVDLVSISPLDKGTILDSVAKCGRVLVVHEDNRSFGVGAEVAAIIGEEAFWNLETPVRRLAMVDVPAMPYAPDLEQAVTVGVDEITSEIQATINS